jgi:hypothetical protein
VCAPSLSDTEAAAAVTHKREQRPSNIPANNYVPSATELQTFHRASREQENPVKNPLNRYVDGLDGMRRPSTDDLIQWGAHKWGIPEDWLRAQYAQESNWEEGHLGDRARVSNEWYGLYPLQARIPNSSDVYQSMGITQVKWVPDGSIGGGTEPLRWKSTAFNIDYQAAEVRYYFDGYCGFCRAGYGAGQQWNSIGAWYQPYPWLNPRAQWYIGEVQRTLSQKPWLSPKF